MEGVFYSKPSSLEIIIFVILNLAFGCHLKKEQQSRRGTVG